MRKVALLLGRATYQEFVAAWPARGNDPFADRINSLPKFVVSKTLEQPEWNATVLDGDVVEEVRRLRQRPGGDLLVYGSRRLVNTLLDHDLIDDIRIWVHPIVVGEGERLFDHPVGKTLELADTTTFDTGVVVPCYKPTRSPARRHGRRRKPLTGGVLKACQRPRPCQSPGKERCAACRSPPPSTTAVKRPRRNRPHGTPGEQRARRQPARASR